MLECTDGDPSAPRTPDASRRRSNQSGTGGGGGSSSSGGTHLSHLKGTIILTNSTPGLLINMSHAQLNTAIANKEVAVVFVVAGVEQKSVVTSPAVKQVVYGTRLVQRMRLITTTQPPAGTDAGAAGDGGGDTATVAASVAAAFFVCAAIGAVVWLKASGRLSGSECKSDKEKVHPLTPGPRGRLAGQKLHRGRVRMSWCMAGEPRACLLHAARASTSSGMCGETCSIKKARGCAHLIKAPCARFGHGDVVV